MKRLLLCLSAVVLLGSMALASSRPDDDRDHDRDGKHKHHYATPEAGVISMLAVSAGTLAGGLALKRRRKAIKKVGA